MPLPDKWESFPKRCKAWVLHHAQDLIHDPKFPLEAIALAKFSVDGSHTEIQECCAQWQEATQNIGSLLWEERPTRRFGILRIPIALQHRDRKALYACAGLSEFMKTLTQMSKDCGEDPKARELLGSSDFRVGKNRQNVMCSYIFGRVHVSIFSLRYSSSRIP